MSRSADIEFTFQRALDVRNTLGVLAANGVSFQDQGEISHVLDRDKMFEWRRSDPSEFDIIVSSAEQADPDLTTFGISLALDPSGTGGDLLFAPGRKTLSFMPEINRVLLKNSKFCDLGWYLRRLVPAFEPLGLESIEASDY